MINKYNPSSKQNREENKNGPHNLFNFDIISAINEAIKLENYIKPRGLKKG